MAKCTVQMPDDFLMKLSRLGNKTDEIVPKVLEAGAKIVESEVKQELTAVIGHGTKEESRSTGELVKALGVSKPRQDYNGDFNVKVGFDENRPDGKSNAMLANIIEYGKHGQTPKPFLKKAKSKSKSACVKAMIDTLNSEVDKV